MKRSLVLLTSAMFYGFMLNAVSACSVKASLKIPSIRGKIGLIQCGDIQWGAEGQAVLKRGHVEMILNITKKDYSSPDLADRTFVVVETGDLIHANSDTKAIKYASVLKKDPRNTGNKGKLEDFKNGFLKPLESEGVLVLLLPGNHDYWDYTQSALDFILKRHGRMYYAVDIGKILFISCAVWPDKDIVSWLKKVIADKQKKNANVIPPIVIAFHNNILGNHNDWWTIAERQEFLAAIKGKNVQLITHGHDHQTYRGTVDGIPVVCSGGDIVPISLFNEDGTYEKTIYFKAEESKGSFIPKPVNVDQIPVMPLWATPATEEEAKSAKNQAMLMDQQYCGSNFAAWIEGEIVKYGSVALGWTDDQMDKFIDEKVQEYIKKFPGAAVGIVIGEENLQLIKEYGKRLTGYYKEKALQRFFAVAGAVEEMITEAGLIAVDYLLATTDFIVSVVTNPKKSLEAAKKYGEDTVKTAQKIVNSGEERIKDLKDTGVKITKEAEESGKKAVKELEAGWKKAEEEAAKAAKQAEEFFEGVGEGGEKVFKEVDKGGKKVFKEVGSWFS